MGLTLTLTLTDARKVAGGVGHGRVGWVRAGAAGCDDRLGQECAQVSLTGSIVNRAHSGLGCVIYVMTRTPDCL